MDVDTIQPGVDFVQVIEDAVGSCDVLLALIGDEWLSASDPLGNRRLDDSEDFIRVEIAAALTRSVPVIPVLLENARMPTAAELPPDLARLARINALDISDKRWEYDVGRLVAALEDLTTASEARGQSPPGSATDAAVDPTTESSLPGEGGSGRKKQRARRKIALIAIATAFLVVACGALLTLAGDNEGQGHPQSPSSSVLTRADARVLALGDGRW